MDSSSRGMLYRPLRPGDYTALKLLHQVLFPLDYDDDFFGRAVHGMDDIVAWAALAPLPTLTPLSVGSGDMAPQLLPPPLPPPPLPQFGQQQGQQGQQQQAVYGGDVHPELLAGFITARSFPALYADPHDRQLLGLAGPEEDQQRLLYVLTLGVAQPYQRHGIARHLLDLTLSYASEAGCRAVYLHVACFNQAARAFYERAGFRQLAVLPDFYVIRTARQPQPGRDRYDACLFGCLVQPPPPTPWNMLNTAVAPLTAVVHGINACMPVCGAARKEGQAGGAAPGGAQVLQVLEEGGHFGGGVAQQQRWQQQPSSPPKQAPDWLRGLFARQQR